MSTISNDEGVFVQRLAKTVTQLRIDDWNDKTIEFFINTLKSMKETIETFNKDIQQNSKSLANNYKIYFINRSGDSIEKTFPKVKCSDIAKLLYNEMESSLDEYGRAISDDEKRQILMELIEKYM